MDSLLGTFAFTWKVYPQIQNTDYNLLSFMSNFLAAISSFFSCTIELTYIANICKNTCPGAYADGWQTVNLRSLDAPSKGDQDSHMARCGFSRVSHTQLPGKKWWSGSLEGDFWDHSVDHPGTHKNMQSKQSTPCDYVISAGYLAFWLIYSYAFFLQAISMDHYGWFLALKSHIAWGIDIHWFIFLINIYIHGDLLQMFKNRIAKVCHA